jgi:thioredoxin 1
MINLNGVKKRIGVFLGIFSMGFLSVIYVKPTEDKKNSGIHFQNGNFHDALALAKKENKFLFLNISTSWCGPCKMLKRNTFKNEKVGAFFNDNFINFAVDGEVGEGISLAQKYRISGYPSLLFFRPSGSLHVSTSGYHHPKQFRELGKYALVN